MADADGFILAALQQSGCVDAGVDASSWSSFETLAAIVSACLVRIQESDDSVDFGLATPFEVPKGVAARHRLGSKLAGLLKELGYAGDCGYNHFLYPSEKETRSILSWLVGKLPRTRQEEDIVDDSKPASIQAENSGTTRDGEDGFLRSIPDLETDGAAINAGASAVASIFSAWKSERTAYLLPSRCVRGIRGYQQLPLRTEHVILPWVCGAPADEQQQPEPLFNAFPASAIRVTSLLEALSSRAARSRLPELDDSFIGDEEGAVVGDSFAHGGTDKVLLTVQGSAQLQDPRLRAGAAGPGGSLVHTPLEPVSADADQDALPIDSPPALESASKMKDSPPVDAKMDASPRTETSKKDDEEDIEVLQAQTDKAQQRIAAMRKAIAKDRARLQQTQRHVADGDSARPALEKQVTTEKKLLAMLPAAEENIGKLESLCAKTQHKLDELSQEWRKTRDPLVREQEELVAQAGQSGVQARGRRLVTEMKTFRVEMQQMSGMIQDKTQALQSLEKALAVAQATNKSHLSRNSYTSRIMDIIKQVHKQKQEIAKIIDDITAMQKQLNASAEKLKRSEAVAEDKLFSAATKKFSSSASGLGIAASVGFTAGREPAANTEAYVECYRKFTQVRELFEALLAVIGEVGKKENGVRDLNNWIRQLEARDSGRHVDKVLADLQAVREENSALINQLRSASVSSADATDAQTS